MNYLKKFEDIGDNNTVTFNNSEDIKNYFNDKIDWKLFRFLIDNATMLEDENIPVSVLVAVDDWYNVYKYSYDPRVSSQNPNRSPYLNGKNGEWLRFPASSDFLHVPHSTRFKLGYRFSIHMGDMDLDNQKATMLKNKMTKITDALTKKYSYATVYNGGGFCELSYRIYYNT